MATPYIGKRVMRNEDPRLLTGQALFVDDVHLPDMLHVAFLRSPYAHARIKDIDLTAALRRPGVVAAYGAAELGSYWRTGALLVDPPPIPDLVFNKRTQPILAEDALTDIVVAFEPLPAVVDLERALEPGSARVHDDLDSNVAAHVIQ